MPKRQAKQHQRRKGVDSVHEGWSLAFASKCRNVFVCGALTIILLNQTPQSHYSRYMANINYNAFSSYLTDEVVSNASGAVATNATGRVTTRSKKIPSDSQLVIDLLGIGSKDRPQLLEAQKQSFGSHKSVRYFFNATENDDDDPLCSAQLPQEQVWRICRYCSYTEKRYDPIQNAFLQYTRNYFATKNWLRKKANPVGWMCAQRRPLHGLYKVFEQFYRNGVDLPDHLILMDDDTYYNLEEFQKLYRDDTPELPLVRAGCLVRSPIHQINLTFPFGGYGVIFNRAALQVLMKPIHCPRDEEVCSRLQKNEIFENDVFLDGMSSVDLMQAYAKREPYRLFDQWTTGYCVHSDWALGYFINFYNVTRKSSEPAFANVANDRLEYWLGSGIYKNPDGLCKNSGVDQCQPDSLICHYMTPESIINFTNRVKQRVPDRFRAVTS